MWPLFERVIEVWCCRMPSACLAVCLSGCLAGCFLTVWTRATGRGNCCAQGDDDGLWAMWRQRGWGRRGAWKTVSICKLVVVAAAAYKRLGVVSADGLSFQARNERNLRLRGICTEFEFDKVQNPLHFEDWLTSYPWMDLNGNITFHPAPLPPAAAPVACWCSVNKRKIIKM